MSVQIAPRYSKGLAYPLLLFRPSFRTARLTTLRHDPNLTFLFVQVDGTIVHAWPSPVRLKSAFSVMWSASYHLTEETSRFILS